VTLLALAPMGSGLSRRLGGHRSRVAREPNMPLSADRRGWSPHQGGGNIRVTSTNPTSRRGALLAFMLHRKCLGMLRCWHDDGRSPCVEQRLTKALARIRRMPATT
jgi:hypothetical protein